MAIKEDTTWRSSRVGTSIIIIIPNQAASINSKLKIPCWGPKTWTRPDRNETRKPQTNERAELTAALRIWTPGLLQTTLDGDGDGGDGRALWLLWSDELVALGLWSLPKPSQPPLLLLRFAVLFVPDAIVPAPGGHDIHRHHVYMYVFGLNVHKYFPKWRLPADVDTQTGKTSQPAGGSKIVTAVAGIATL